MAAWKGQTHTQDLKEVKKQHALENGHSSKHDLNATG